MRAFHSLLVVATVLNSSSTARGGRDTERIGVYLPPRSWPVRSQSYDLLHQRIALQFDMRRRLVQGQVTTQVVLTIPTSSVRLDAENLMIDAARDASGRPLGFVSDTAQVTRHWNSATRRLDVTVKQEQPIDSLHPLFRFPTTIRVITRDSVVRRQIMVSKVRETFPLHLPGAPLSFRFDEGGWLLGTIQTDQTREELAELATHDLDLSARIWALRQLDTFPDPVVVAARRFIMLNEPQPLQRVRALAQSATDHSIETIAIVRASLRDPDSDLRAQAIRTLGDLDSTGIDTLAGRMYETDPNTSVRIAALSTLAETAGKRALSLLIGATAGGLPFPLRLSATWDLAKINDPRAESALERLTLPSEPRDLRLAGLDGLAAQRDSMRAAAVASRYLDDHDRIFAAAAKRVMRPRKVQP